MHPASIHALLSLKGVKLPRQIGSDGASAYVAPAADGGTACSCTGFAQRAGCPRCDGRGSAN